MNMKQLRYVTVLSQYNNFTRAAEELGISQPSLSQYIKKIEKQIGAELFVRAGQDVRLTDAGNTYLEIGRKILNLENEMNNRMADISNDRFGTLTIGIAPYRCANLMPRVIGEFRKAYPHIKILISEQITSELKESAERGKLDLCISTLPIDEEKFKYEQVMREGTVLAVSKKLCSEYVITEKSYETISIDRVKEIPFVSLPESQVMGRTLNEICDKRKLDLDIVVECQDLMAVHSMVEEGIGAALLPCSLVNRHESKEMNYYFLEEVKEHRDIVVFYRQEQYLSKPMQKIIEILTTIFNTEGWITQ